MKQNHSELTLIMLISLSLVLPYIFIAYIPTAIISNTGRFVIQSLYYFPILVFLVIRILHKKHHLWRHYGWKKPEKQDIALMVLLILLSFGFGLLISTLIPGSRHGAIQGAIPAFIVFSIEVSILEEIFFRSWIIGSLTEKAYPIPAAAMSSIIIFSGLHAAGGLQSIITAFFIGTVYTYIFIMRRCVFTVILAHIGHNLLAILFISYN